jgi:DNA polymerase-1
MKKIAVLDTETQGLYGKLLLGGIKVDGKFFYFEDADKLRNFLNDLINNRYVIVGHNLFYDFFVLDFIPPNRDCFDDTYLFMKAYQVEYKIEKPERGMFGLENLCKFFNLYEYKTDKNKIRKDLEKGGRLLDNRLKDYLTEDLNATDLLYQHTITKHEKFKPVYLLDKAFLIRLLQIQKRGIPINIEEVSKLLRGKKPVFNQNLIAFQKTYQFNPFSPIQVKNKLNLPDAQKQTLLYHLFTTKDERLKQCIHDILVLKKQQDEISYLEEWIDKGSSGRLYGHYDVCGAITGRLSCSDLNLLNIPRHLRYLFYKSPFLKYDFSQIELRLAGQIYYIPTFITAYRNNEDLHSKTASILFDKPIDQITKEQRQIAKQFNFALIYGASVQTLQQLLYEGNILLTYEETKFLRAKWMSYHRRVSEHIQSIMNALKNGSITVTTVLRRNRYTEHLNIALNFPIQGTGAELLKGTVVLFTKKYPNAKIVNLIHDEIQIECESQEEAQEYIKALDEVGAEMWKFLFKNFEIPFQGEATVF